MVLPVPLVSIYTGGIGPELNRWSQVDILLLDDDVAMPNRLMIGPETWREYFKPRLARLINIAREESPQLLVFYHCDGNFTRLIPDLVDVGVNVINPV